MIRIMEECVLLISIPVKPPSDQGAMRASVRTAETLLNQFMLGENTNSNNNYIMKNNSYHFILRIFRYNEFSL